MPRMHETLLLRGEDVTIINEILANTGSLATPNTPILVGPFTVNFRDRYSLTIQVPNALPLKIQATLRDHSNSVTAFEEFDGPIDRDYSLMMNNTTYECSIVRAANTSLTPAAAVTYNESYGVRCPACGSDMLHDATPQRNLNVITQQRECCACGARWVDIFLFSTISVASADWVEPKENVPHQDAH